MRDFFAQASIRSRKFSLCRNPSSEGNPLETQWNSHFQPRPSWHGYYRSLLDSKSSKSCLTETYSLHQCSSHVLHPHFGRGIWIVRHRPRYLTPGGQPETTIMQPPRFHLCRGMSLRAASVRRKDDQQFWDWKWKLQSSNILSSSSLARFCPTQRPRFLLTLLSVCSYVAVYHIFDTPQY